VSFGQPSDSLHEAGKDEALPPGVQMCLDLVPEDDQLLSGILSGEFAGFQVFLPGPGGQVRIPLLPITYSRTCRSLIPDCRSLIPGLPIIAVAVSPFTKSLQPGSADRRRDYPIPIAGSTLKRAHLLASGFFTQAAGLGRGWSFGVRPPLGPPAGHRALNGISWFRYRQCPLNLWSVSAKSPWNSKFS
jgi:hypothetical protein